MGLLLSILVSCVGVVELISFYSYLRRTLRVANSNDSDLETIRGNYKKMLNKEYRQIFAEVNGKDIQPKTTTNFALSTSPKAIFSSEISENDNKTSMSIVLEECNSSIKGNILQLSAAEVDKFVPSANMEINTNELAHTEPMRKTDVVSVFMDENICRKSTNHNSELRTPTRLESHYVFSQNDETSIANKLTLTQTSLQELNDVSVPANEIIYHQDINYDLKSNSTLGYHEEVINTDKFTLTQNSTQRMRNTSTPVETITSQEGMSLNLESESTQFESNYIQTLNDIKDVGNHVTLHEKTRVSPKDPSNKVESVSTELDFNFIEEPKNKNSTYTLEQSHISIEQPYRSIKQTNHIVTTMKENSHDDCNLYNIRSDVNTLREEVYLDEGMITIGEASSSIEKIYLQEESMAELFPRRSLSPFPTYERLAPKHSICSELVEDPIISVREVEEDYDVNVQSIPYLLREERRSFSLPPNISFSDSRSSLSPAGQSDSEIFFESRQRSLSPCEQVLDENTVSCEEKKPKPSDLMELLAHKPISDCQIVKDDLRKSPSLEQVFPTTAEDNAQASVVVVQEIFSDDFKNSLDGVKSKNPNDERKREFKRKRNSRNKMSQNSRDEYSDSKEDLLNLISKESALETGIPVKEEAAVSFSSNLLTDRNVVCEKSPSSIEDEIGSSETTKAFGTNISSNNVLQSKETGNETSTPGPSKEEEKPEPFWLIFSGEYTKAMNKDWHGQHFCCWQCDESLTGQRYVLRDDHPYCVACYESVFANACEKCSKTIGIDSKDLSYKDKHWHEACFLCTICNESLVDKQFGSKADRIYCGRCYDEKFASRCDGCGEIFRAGTKKMEYKTRQWHEKCFCCVVCRTPIGTQSFIPREQEIYCAKCYEEKFATRCIKCNKVITSGGVTYKNEPWHRECFTCTHCQTSLAGARFTSRDDKPYCAECFGELFAKRCFACSKPITGIGGTKFISFEDRHWHNDCFFCAMCRTSLVGRGFITDQDEIICPECAKQKLM